MWYPLGYYIPQDGLLPVLCISKPSCYCIIILISCTCQRMLRSHLALDMNYWPPTWIWTAISGSCVVSNAWAISTRTRIGVKRADLSTVWCKAMHLAGHYRPSNPNGVSWMPSPCFWTEPIGSTVWPVPSCFYPFEMLLHSEIWVNYDNLTTTSP